MTASLIRQPTSNHWRIAVPLIFALVPITFATAQDEGFRGVLLDDLLICANAPSWDARQSRPTPFSTTPLLEIRISPAPETNIALLIGRALVQSAATWHSICASCEPQSVLAVLVGNQIYMRQALAEALTAELSGENLESALLRALSSRTSIYLPIDPSGPELSRLRDIDTEMEHLKILRSAFLEPSHSGRARLDLRLVQRAQLSCRRRTQQPRNIVACGVPGVGVELNVQDYQFSFLYDRRGLTIGSGRSVVLEWTLLHELGHWLGLSDRGREGRSIMSGIYDQGRCLDSEDVADVNGLTEGSGVPAAVTSCALFFE